MAKAHRRYTSRYGRELAEINLLIDGLGPAGLVPDDFSPLSERRAPDFVLHFGEQTVYCECTSAGDQSSILWRLSVADLQVAANDMLQRHPARIRLDARYLAFIPGSPVRPDDILGTVNEIATFIAEEDLDHYSTRYGILVPPTFHLLSRAGTVAYVGQAQEPQIVIQQPASSFGGASEGVVDIVRALRRKRERSYEGYRPIWLILGATDIIAPLESVIRELVKLNLSLEPFESVFVATSRESFRLRNSALVASS
jgi:hypothetical protein